jgi:hypothetical protein
MVKGRKASAGLDADWSAHAAQVSTILNDVSEASAAADQMA